MFEIKDMSVSDRKAEKKVDLDELVRLRKLGYTEKELAQIFNVTQQAISLNLQKAKEKGLLKEDDIGTDLIEEYDLTPVDEESKTFIDGKLVSEYKDGKWVKVGSEPKELKYRCLKCHNYLTPLKVKVQDEKGRTYERQETFTYKGRVVTFDRQPLSDVLIKAGYTHLCVFCMTAYRKEPSDYSKLKENKCPKCDGKILYYPVHGDLNKLVPYCEKCGIVFLKEPEDEEKKEGKTRVVKEGKSLKLETSVRD